MAGQGRRASVTSRSAGRGGEDQEQEQEQQALTLTPDEVATLDAMIRAAMPDISSIVPAHVNPAQYEAIVLGMMHRDLKLAKAVMGNGPSFMAALADCARLGLTPGDGYAFMVFRSKGAPGGYAITGTTEYTGELQLIQQTGLVRGVVAEVVFANDDYEPGEYAEDKPTFRKFGRGATDEQRGGTPDKDLGYELPGVNYGGGQSTDPGRLRGQLAFGYVVFHDGSTSPPIEMSRQEIMNHRAVSRNQDAWDGPFWRSWWLKTIIHELYKWLQKSTSYLQRAGTARAALAASPLGALQMAPPVTSLSGAGSAPAVAAPAPAQRAIGNGGGQGGGEAGSPPAQRQGREPASALDRDLAAIVGHFDRWGVPAAEREAAAVAILETDTPKIRRGELTSGQALTVAARLDQIHGDAGEDHAAAREFLQALIRGEGGDGAGEPAGEGDADPGDPA